MGNAYADLYKSYQFNNNTDSAYKYQGLALSARDSTNQAKINSLTAFQNLSFDEQFRLQEMEKEKELTKSRTRTYALLAGLGVFLLAAIVLFRNNRQKQQANKILADTLSHLKSTQAQLIQSEKMASLGELTAGIAHEIQNPLNFVNNFSEVNSELIAEMKQEIENGNLDQVKTIANSIDENEQKITIHGKRADTIVKGMLQHSRNSTDQKEITDINALADEYLRLAYHGMRAKDKNFNATLNTDFDTSIGKINIIPQEIGRVILNLVNNAFYALSIEAKAKEGSSYQPGISVSTKKMGDKVFIAVKDNGNGIPQKVIDKIFQPFFTTKPTGQGTGLGYRIRFESKL